MTITDKLNDLIKNESLDATIPFLKGLSKDEKKELAPDLKKLNAYYSEFVDLSTMITAGRQWQVGHSYGTRARGKQNDILSIASFVCLDKKGFEKAVFPTGVLTQEFLDQILPWYTPSWFKQLLEDINTGKSYTLNYDLIMHLEAAGYFTPSPELILIHLPNLTISEEILLKYPDTLNKHFWYIFDYPSNIHNVSRYQKESEGWSDIIVKFAGEGRLDRMRILKESLLTANRNFNKVLAGWFMDLFMSLKPTEEELQQLQPVLMMLLGSRHTTAVTLALNSLKQLKDLDYHTFITHLSQAILSGTKSILTAILQLSEAICKKHEDARQQISIHLCQIFLNKEESIQLKASKLITTYGFPASEELQYQLQQYSDAMLTSIRQSLLPDAVKTVLEEEELPEEIPLIGTHNLIPSINTVEELVYFTSQVFENNEPYHAELLPAALINLQHLITEDVLIQLKPAIQRADKLRSNPTNNMGELGHFLTRFMLYYFKPVENKAAWKVDTNAILPYVLLWKYALEKLVAKDTLPLLSTPTHTPGWIDPVVLVKRLAQYKGTTPHDLDLQIAICRCALEDTTEATALTQQLLTGEHRDLLLFLFNKPDVAFQDGNAWIQAANRKGIDLSIDKIPSAYLNGRFNWSTEVENYISYGAYNRETKNYDKVPATRVNIRVKFPTAEPLNETNPLLQEYLMKRHGFYRISSADVPRMLSLTPADTSLMLANIVTNLTSSSGMDELITPAITFLKDQTLPYKDTALLFIATCMLHADKTIRTLAAECWITGVSYKRLNSEDIGRIIGIHQNPEWAPMKRFTDLISEHMMQISKQHNQELEVLLSACIALLPDHPVKNLKKLLEVYTEVLTVNGNTVTHPIVKNRLMVWESSSGYKKLVSKMIS